MPFLTFYIAWNLPFGPKKKKGEKVFFSPSDQKRVCSLASPVHGEGLEVSGIANLLRGDLEGNGLYVTET
jgi:hypothetical protein